jgi:hypothetical protein
MISNLKSFLATYLETEETKIESYFNDKNVVGFLIIWTIFEQKKCSGFLKFSELTNLKIEISWKDEFEEEFTYFYSRYQDPKLYNNLRHKEDKEDIKTILSNRGDVTNEDKMYLLLYVVYRYRNNIFHGNKSPESWSKYKEPISRCVNILRLILDENVSS